MKNAPVLVVDRELRDAEGLDEALSKVQTFLAGEFARAAPRQCIGVELLYEPGHGYRDESLREWTREEEAEFFEGTLCAERLASRILEIAEDEAVAKDFGKHRFIVRTRQYVGIRQTTSFPLYVGEIYKEEDQEDQMTKNKNDKNVKKPDEITIRAVIVDPRKHLLASVAAHIAATVVASPSKKATSSEAIAEISVDIAEAILRKAGL